MNPARWKRVQELFHLAVDLEGEGRTQFLRDACGDDYELLVLVEGMLDEDGRECLLDCDVLEVARRVSDRALFSSFEESSPYRLLRVLGEGGMGVVYLAERKDLRSKVAIKVLRDAWLSPGRLKRFAIEQRTLAQLTHPFIARLYDADSFPDGTPYFVMEYVEGVPLTQYCQQRRSSIDMRLRLIRAACEAVLYAHEHGVIHRDLKPSNILVKDDGTVRLLDFGIAKPIESFGDPKEKTLTGLRLMTPAYASPEQIRGEKVGIQTDIYSLGVILYELLAGRLPVDPSNRTPAEMEKIVTEQECEKPSATARKGARPGESGTGVAVTEKSDWADLDVLCMTAMHRDVQRRYPSAGAMIRDIDHYARREPLEARPDSFRYRAAKFVRRHRPAVVAGALACGAVAALAGLAFNPSLHTVFPWIRTRIAAPQITSLAVLPMANVSGDPSQDYLADGITEALITDLSKVRALKVISRTTAMRYRGHRQPLPEIARQLNVNGIIEGTVRRAGGHVEIAVELVFPATNTRLWTDRGDWRLQDMPDLERELARRILQETRVPVRPSEEKQLVSSESVVPLAQDLYMRGRFFWNLRTRVALLKSVDYFRQSIQADTNYPQAYAGLADAYVELVGFGDLKPEQGIPEAREAALKAIAIDDSVAEGHNALAYCAGLEWNWEGATKEFQRAIELNPGYVAALYQYAFFLSTMGQHAKAIALARQALELDPLSAVVSYRAGRVYFQARDYPKATEQFRRILELNPSDPLGLYGLGLVYRAQGRPNEAIPYLQKESFEQGFDLDAAYAAAGNSAEANSRLARDLQRLRAEKVFIRPSLVAEVYASLGDKDKAIRWLDQGYTEHDAFMILLKVWPAYDPLRSDPRFEALVRRMNFPP
jgi:serine/threonine protein kinase/Tfp pilus assembly protein PilF